MKKDTLNFQEIKHMLELYGCTVEGPDRWGVYTIGDQNLEGYIEEVGDGRWFLWIDNANCFNKCSQCPLQLSSETLWNAVEGKIEEVGIRLVSALTLLGSPEGYQISTNFEYLNKNPFLLKVQEVA
jgi:hypothetical protein